MTRQSWGAVTPRPAASASPAPWLVAVGLGALVLSGAVQAIALGGLGTLETSLLTTSGLAASVLLQVAGAAALTAGLIGLVLNRSLPLLAPAPAAPPDEDAEAPGPPPGADHPDARWRP